MNHVVTEVDFYRDRTLVPGYYVGGKTGTAQIWDPKLRGGKGDWKHNIFNYSFVGFIGKTSAAAGPRRRRPDRGGPPDDPTARATSRCRSMSFELFRRIATDAITTPDLLPPTHAASPPRPPTERRAPRPVSGGLMPRPDVATVTSR